MAPHPIPLPCALTFLPPSHRDTTTLSPCWAPHFMTQERIMFLNPTPSKPRLSPAATIDATTSFLTPPLLCASILQPAAPVCNAVGLLILLKLCPVFTFLQQLMTTNSELFTHTLVLQCFPSTSSHQPQTTHVFADSRIALLCHALRICVAHAPTEFCPFSLLVH